jgi:hypothetical protein
MRKTVLWLSLAMLSLTTTCFAQPSPAVFSAAGADAASIRATIDEFRAAVGSTLNAPGPNGNPEGRREINWDGVPAQFSAPNDFPLDFFNRNSARGAVFSAGSPAWVSFQVSGNAADGPARFDNLQAGYASLFTVFSAEKLFLSVGSNVYDTEFFVPGTDTRATVNGFGAVFTNVAIPFTTTIEYLSAEGVSLGKFSARVAPKGLSFLGAVYPSRMVSRVRITLGTAAPGVAEDLEQGVNIVAADDFIYGEPVSPCDQ